MKKIIKFSILFFVAVLGAWVWLHRTTPDENMVHEDDGFYVPGEYLVIDLSTGPDAEHYPSIVVKHIPAGGWKDEHKTTKLVLRKINKGTFIMGSPAGEVKYSDRLIYNPDDLNRKPNVDYRRHVTLTEDFYLGIFQTTRMQYALVMGENPLHERQSYSNVDMTNANTLLYGTLPVTANYEDIRGYSRGEEWPANHNVDSWSFMGKLRAKTGLLFDLPTEAQWEYACRAGTTTALNNGKDLTNMTNCLNLAKVGWYWYSHYENINGYDRYPVAVGLLKPNAWGLHDMHGNVRELCLDWFYSEQRDDVFDNSPLVDPKGAIYGHDRVARGGNYNCTAHECSSTYRTCASLMCNTGIRVCIQPVSTSVNKRNSP